jgi:hypothetical protein
VGRIITETFPPEVDERCDRCAFRRSCPSQAAGRQVVS